MTRWLLLSAALISLPAFTDWAVDHQFRNQHADRNHGYSQKDRDDLAELVARSGDDRTPPDCGLDWLCLKTWAEGKPLPAATPQDLAALVERSNREAKRRHVLSGTDEQAIMHELWGGR